MEKVHERIQLFAVRIRLAWMAPRMTEHQKTSLALKELFRCYFLREKRAFWHILAAWQERLALHNFDAKSFESNVLLFRDSTVGESLTESTVA